MALTVIATQAIFGVLALCFSGCYPAGPLQTGTFGAAAASLIGAGWPHPALMAAESGLVGQAVRGTAAKGARFWPPLICWHPLQLYGVHTYKCDGWLS
jgi:hypothetical protein